MRPFQPDRDYLLEVSSLHDGSEGDAGFNSHEDTQIENLSVDCAFVTSGIRFGSAAVTTRGLKEADMETIVDFIDRVISNPEDQESIEAVAKDVNQLMEGRPLFAY